MAFTSKPYEASEAIAYAHEWAFSRNPNYYDFDNDGGDCTNFMSQCLYAGSNVMNHKPITGWYYYDAYNRSAAWTSVDYFNQFLLTNKGTGPYGHACPLSLTKEGDYIQLATVKDYYHHSVIIVKKDDPSDLSKIYITCHTLDSDMRPLDTYDIRKMRCISIDGCRIPL